MEETKYYFGEVKNYPGEYSALNIIYYGCYNEENDEIIEKEYEKVLSEWQ